MEPLDAVDSLARRARGERAPATHIDVERLLSQARREQVGGMPLFPLAWSAAGASVAAAIVLFLAIGSSSVSTASASSTDSVSQLFAPAQVDMP